MSRVGIVFFTVMASLVVAVGLFVGLLMKAPLLVVSMGATPAVGMAWLVFVHDHASRIAPALAWSSAFVVLVELLGAVSSSTTWGRPLFGAEFAAHWAVGIWPLNLFGLLLLLLVFPNGDQKRSARHQRVNAFLPVGYLVGTGLVVAGLWDAQQLDGRIVGRAGEEFGPMLLIGFLIVVGCLSLAVGEVGFRFVRGGEDERRRIRWLMLTGVIVIGFLVAGWVMQGLDMPVPVSFAPFLAAILFLVPLAVTIATLNEELVDVEWLLSSSLAWLIALVLSSALFAVCLLGIARLLRPPSTTGIAATAFLVALVLFPVHRAVNSGVSRIVDRERVQSKALAEQFVADTRNGRRQPEEVEALLQTAQADPALRVLIQGLSEEGWFGVNGETSMPSENRCFLQLSSGEDVIARIEFSDGTPHNRRKIAALAKTVFLPIEVCRLRASLHHALEEVESSRLRITRAAVVERKKLEHDLHDGVQQSLVGTAARLRALQMRVGPQFAPEVDRAVVELRRTNEELRRLAHGLRPSRLDDGLAAALATLVSRQPIWVEVQVGELPDLDETVAATSYYLVAEAVANALKHASASRIMVRANHSQNSLVLQVTDDGRGIEDRSAVLHGSSLISLRDRAASLGGSISVGSSPANGTTLRVVIPCA